jgi:hypothetical protein
MANLQTSAGLAFALVFFAGLCAPLGACVVVFMQRGQRKLLASAIALAAGVMLFVSMTEVLNESYAEISQSGFAEALTLLILYGVSLWLLAATAGVHSFRTKTSHGKETVSTLRHYRPSKCTGGSSKESKQKWRQCLFWTSILNIRTVIEPCFFMPYRCLLCKARRHI